MILVLILELGLNFNTKKSQTTKQSKKMTKFFTLLLTALVFIGCSSSSDTTNCPNFDNEILKYIPYYTGDDFILINNSDNSETKVSVKHSSLRHRESFTSTQECGECDDYLKIVFTIRNLGEMTLIKMISYNEIETDHLSLDVGFEQPKALEELTINDIKYKDVLVYEVEANQENAKYKKIVFAKDFGLVAIYETEGSIWTLKENKTKEVDLKKYNVLISDC